MNRSDKFIIVLGVLMIASIVALLVGMILMLEDYHKAQKNDCWKETATNYCKTQNLSFKYVDGTYEFRCENKDDKHKTGLYEFRFTEQEREVCRA